MTRTPATCQRPPVGFELRTITLIGEQQDDGYIFITSPELKGFSLMLEPDEDKNLATIISAVHEPLITYLDVLNEAKIGVSQ